jgi:hypothetical protein
MPLTIRFLAAYGFTIVSFNEDAMIARRNAEATGTNRCARKHFRGDRYKWSARVTVVNLTNKEALYNFLSTFSGTHYVTPRTVTGTIGFHF